MAELITGKLLFNQDKHKWQVEFFNERKQQPTTMNCELGELSADIPKNEAEQFDVQFERKPPHGELIRIRLAGTDFVAPASRRTTSPAPQAQGRGNTPPPREDRNAQRERREPSRERTNNEMPGEFHNPYNFVPALPRSSKNDLGDREPSGHDRFMSDKCSGKLRVKMSVETPLLLPDTARVEIIEKGKKKGHKIFDVRTDENGKPFINPTAVKGMLRAAYEAVTNSRLSVFHNHDERLAFRGGAKIGAVPARVTKREDGELYFRVMRSHLLRLGFAAKLKRYDIKSSDKNRGEDYAAKRYDDKSLPQTGKAVWVQLNPKGAVERIVLRNIGETKAGWQAGWVYITGANISGKKNERVFLESPSDLPIKVEEKHKKLWRELISNYQDIHRNELAERANREPPAEPSDYLDNEPGKTAWSHHIYTPDAKELKDGTLCYLNFKRNTDREIDAVIPVTISRRLFEIAPAKLLPEELHPATDIEKLSPADRVFGWVRQGKGKSDNGAYRGQVRIGKVEYSNDNQPDHKPIERFDADNTERMGVPLQILGQPKPQQGRFYVAETPKTGEAQIEKRSNEDSGFQEGRGLRGRKVYPHHKVPTEHWDNPTQQREKPLLEKYFQEFRRPDSEDQRDKQNRSVKGWVAPETVFEFDIHFINLSEVELGALLWLLQLEPDHFHRFGGGKPLGFGSVRLSVNGKEICKGENMKKRYESFDEVELQLEDAQSCINKFKEAIEEGYGQPFDQVSFIKAFLKAASGFDKPIHYPRTNQAPNVDGKSFEWFVANNQIERGSVKYGFVLPNLSEDEGLPILENKGHGRR